MTTEPDDDLLYLGCLNTWGGSISVHSLGRPDSQSHQAFRRLAELGKVRFEDDCVTAVHGWCRTTEEPL